MSETLTVKTLGAAIPESPRTVQFWASSGVLLPSDETAGKGKGTARVFPETEIPFGRLAKKLADMNSPIGEIRQVVARLRAVDPEPALQSVMLDAAHFQRSLAEAQRLTAESQQSLAELMVTLLEGAPPHSLPRPADVTRLYHDAIGRLLNAMTTAIVAGGFEGQVNLVIAITPNESGVWPEVMLVPKNEMGETLAREYLSTIKMVGYKVIPLEADEVRFKGEVPKPLSDLYRDIYETVGAILNEMAASQRKAVSLGEEMALLQREALSLGERGR